MAIFSEIKRFYDEGKFSDLKMVSGTDDGEVFCHSLVISSAVPGLKDLLQEHSSTAEDVATLVFPETPGSTLRSIVSDIYLALVQVRWHFKVIEKDLSQMAFTQQ